MAARIVELAGPAGAGKTTLAAAVGQVDPELAMGIPLGPVERRLAHAAATLRVLPACLRNPGERRWFTADEIRAMGYLDAWHRHAVRTAGEGPVVVLDHGPVFRLAQLAEFGPPATDAPAFRRWWEESVRRWARLLDAVVVLDAPDDVLTYRIRSREQQHAVKTAEDSAVRVFLGRYRSAFERVLSRLTAAAEHCGSPLEVLIVPTDGAGPAVLAERLDQVFRRPVTREPVLPHPATGEVATWRRPSRD